jgi:hypothetical protein
MPSTISKSTHAAGPADRECGAKLFLSLLGLSGSAGWSAPYRNERTAWTAGCLDVFWLQDDSPGDTDDLPDPAILAAEIVEDLQAALDQFAHIAAELANGPRKEREQTWARGATIGCRNSVSSSAFRRAKVFRVPADKTPEGTYGHC